MKNSRRAKMGPTAASIVPIGVEKSPGSTGGRKKLSHEKNLHDK